ncbi:hypothetical protein BJ165DRAFT_266160 [Panaeolus papilionaceus]|nr:hypothetical protein BJ165DRAFT_266160 [Panaeolus papilionaceus]
MSLFKLSITGEVSVEPCESIQKYHNWCILILGPTGAGKSSFIEALAGKDQSLGISKDQLAGVTQEITAYGVKNAELRFVNEKPWVIYFIDTPGFSDSKMSEIEIICKVKRWMSDQSVWWINGVLYLSPITDTRVSGSKLRTINMIQSLLFDDAFTGLYIITTMWDQIGNIQAKKRAEANFAQLQYDIWKGPISEGATISKFHNNHDSAIQILRDLVQSGGPYSVLGDESIKPEHPSAPILYQQLLYRISNAQQAADYLRQEKISLILIPDPRLESIVLQRFSEVKEDLAKFLGQLVEFGIPPPGFEGVPERCIYQALLNHVNEAREEQVALSGALTGLSTNPDLAREATLRTQLHLIERELVQHVTRLAERAPPEGYETGFHNLS